jgi:hypothetical protein
MFNLYRCIVGHYKSYFNHDSAVKIWLTHRVTYFTLITLEKKRALKYSFCNKSMNIIFDVYHCLVVLYKLI